MIKPARGSILQIFLRLGYAQKSVRIHNGMCIAKSGLERQLATMRIHLANDHAAGDLRVALIAWLKERGIEVVDHGTPDGASVDYPDHAHPLAEGVAAEGGMGILICGSANGVAMTANKHPEVRAAIAWRPDIARLAREHNNANVLCLPARYLAISDALDCVASFLDTEFEGGRHARRVDKIACS